MKKMLFAIICCLNSITLFSQVAGTKSEGNATSANYDVLATKSNVDKVVLKYSPNLYVYKTYDDFFSNKKTYIGKSEEFFFHDTKLNCIDTITNQNFKVRLRDSSNVVGFWYRGEKFLYGYKHKTFYNYICGNSKLLVVFTGYISSAKWDKNGEFIQGTLNNGIFLTIKNLDFESGGTAYFEKMLKDKPTIYKQYVKERKENKGVFMTHYVEYCQKYIKLYCEN
jgi:hypothetical protein